MSPRPYFEAVARQMGPAGAAGQLAPMPQSRYVLPQFEERTAYGFKRQDPYAKLFEDRIVFMGVQVDDASADDIMAQLLVLESQDPDGLITMYINSPGGSFTALTAIYDTMQYIKPQVQTVCLGQAASAAAVLLAAGSPGKRLALPNARVLIHQPAMEGMHGQASDIEIVADEIDRMRAWLEDTLAAHTGRDRDLIHNDLERDKILTAAAAQEYGIVDQVLSPACPDGAIARAGWPTARVSRSVGAIGSSGAGARPRRGGPGETCCCRLVAREVMRRWVGCSTLNHDDTNDSGGVP